MVNESKTMYLPEDTLENHQGKITFCFCVLRACVCVFKYVWHTAVQRPRMEGVVTERRCY